MALRSDLLLRLGVLAVTLLLGVAVVAVRVSAHTKPLPAKAQLNGLTSQGYPIYGVQIGGRLWGMRVVWGGQTCTGDRTLQWVSDEVIDGTPRFARDGRSFSMTLSRDRYSVRGWTPHETLVLQGTLSADRLAAHGDLRGRINWTKGGRDGGTCESGPVRWHLRAPQ